MPASPPFFVATRLAPQAPRIDPTNDLVFKLLFCRDPDSDVALLSLLHAVLRPARPFRRVQVRNPDVFPHELQERNVVLDLALTLDDGTTLDVEMQARKHAAFRERVLYYWARLHAGTLVHGEAFDRLRRTISIVFLGYREFQGPQFHSTFRALEVHTGELLSDTLEIHTVELPKLPRLADLDLGEANQAERSLLLWGHFLNATLEPQAEELAMLDPGLQKALETLGRLSADESVRRLAELREKAWINDRLERAALRREGHAEGMAEGERKGELKGRAEGLAEGERKGELKGRAEGELRGMIRLFCQMRGLPLEGERLAWLDGANLEELREGWERLQSTGDW